MRLLYAVLLLIAATSMLVISSQNASSTWSRLESEVSCVTTDPPIDYGGTTVTIEEPQCSTNPNDPLFPCTCSDCDYDDVGCVCDGGQCVPDTYGQCSPCLDCVTYPDPDDTTMTTCIPYTSVNPPPAICEDCENGVLLTDDPNDVELCNHPICRASQACNGVVPDTESAGDFCTDTCLYCVGGTVENVCHSSCPGVSGECNGKLPDTDLPDLEGGGSCNSECVYVPPECSPSEPCSADNTRCGECDPSCGASELCDGRSPSANLGTQGYCDAQCIHQGCYNGVSNGVCNSVQCPPADPRCDGRPHNTCLTLESAYCNEHCQYIQDADDLCCDICERNGYVCLAAGEPNVGDYESGAGVECCGDDLGESSHSRETDCTVSCSDNDWPEFLPNVNDKVCCDATSDAVFDGTCYPEGLRPYKYTPGSGGALGSINLGLPPNVIVVDGKWSDCDAQERYCEGDRFRGFCGLNWVVRGTGLPVPFGEYDDPPAPECCGDDAGENYRNTSQGSNDRLIACCGNEVDCVDIDGSCVPPGTLSINPSSNYKCTSGIWSSTSEIVCASIPGEASRLDEMPICPNLVVVI